MDNSDGGGRLKDTLALYRAMKAREQETNAKELDANERDRKHGEEAQIRKRTKRNNRKREFGRGARHILFPCGEDCLNCPQEHGPEQCPYTDEDEDVLMREEYGAGKS